MILKGYHHFDGRHYETGSVHNALAYQGVVAPHTGKPISEAMLMGISGGAVFGYFLFAYKGHDPMLSLITRNTFDPLETLLTRLGVPRDVRQTTDPRKAERNVIDTLANGRPAIVWADLFSLPYADRAGDEQWWAMFPLVVFGHDGDTVHIADRAAVPFQVDAATFSLARARIKKDRFRMMELEPPEPARLRDAAARGIWQCIQLYTEKPPKGARTNFGFAAYRHWASMLTNTRNTQSWARFFPPPAGLFSALFGHGLNPGLVGWVHTWGAGDGAERGLYADFLDEAAVLLDRPPLAQAAAHFRDSQALWKALAEAASPDSAPLLAEARYLIVTRHALFVQRGDGAREERRALAERLSAIHAEAIKAFPMSDAGIADMREAMSRSVMRIHDIEREAVTIMQTAMTATSQRQ